MSRYSIFTERLRASNIYHVYNQTNNKESMFLSDSDRMRFLYNLDRFISPFVNIYAFNLLRNHFHVLLQVKSKTEVLNELSKFTVEQLPRKCKSLLKEDSENMHLVLENRFKSMFSGYSRYFNLVNDRRGNFFHRPFCRKEIDSVEYLKKATYYIHNNSVKHGLHHNALEHEWTSFHLTLAGDQSLISLNKLYDLFGGESEFMKYHHERKEFKNESFIIEEEDVFRQSNMQLINSEEE